MLPEQDCRAKNRLKRYCREMLPEQHN
jgi:hypothetical protein